MYDIIYLYNNDVYTTGTLRDSKTNHLRSPMSARKGFPAQLLRNFQPVTVNVSSITNTIAPLYTNRMV